VVAHLAVLAPAATSPRLAVYVWDLRTQRCLQTYQDEGCLNGMSMACSPDGSLFATGEGQHRLPPASATALLSERKP